MEINKRENIGWIDLLRVTACFLVVFAHCCDPFVARFDTDRPTFLQGCALGSAVRCCVPLFVMMTGVLLFPVRNGMSEFYKKRIGRIVVPLIFWSVMLACIVFHLSELHHHDRQSYHRHVRLHPGNDYHEDLDIHFQFQL